MFSSPDLLEHLKLFGQQEETFQRRLNSDWILRRNTGVWHTSLFSFGFRREFIPLKRSQNKENMTKCDRLIELNGPQVTDTVSWLFQPWTALQLYSLWVSHPSPGCLCCHGDEQAPPPLHLSWCPRRAATCWASPRWPEVCCDRSDHWNTAADKNNPSEFICRRLWFGCLFFGLYKKRRSHSEVFYLHSNSPSNKSSSRFERRWRKPSDLLLT